MLKCEMCNLENLSPDHWVSVMHLEKQLQRERDGLSDLNKGKLDESK